MDEELAMAMAAASSECSSGCQSGWTTYLDDHSSSYSCGTARFRGKARQPSYCDYSEEDDLSMISDASSGPRQQSSAGNDVEGGGGAAAAAAHANAERRGRREAAAADRRQSKRAAAASLLEDTASSPAFFGYSKVRAGPAQTPPRLQCTHAPWLAFTMRSMIADAKLNDSTGDGLGRGRWLWRRGRPDDGDRQCGRLLLRLLHHDGLQGASPFTGSWHQVVTVNV